MCATCILVVLEQKPLPLTFLPPLPTTFFAFENSRLSHYYHLSMPERFLKDPTIRRVRAVSRLSLPSVPLTSVLFFLVISLSDEDLTSIKFIGPGKYLDTFECVLTYRHAP